MVLVKEETRKGPWTEEEDMQLVCFVGLFGERRWDFIAKVSGLHRTGKSCRLRWVNYLHPGLKRGRMTPQEERLVLELHARWGNRWSRIARKLPGRTDNEIKNYWRTHMRKKAQERKRASSSPASAGFPSSSSSNSLSSSSSSSSSSLTGSYTVTSVSPEPTHTGVPQFYDTSTGAAAALKDEVIDEEGVKGYPMEQIWEEIASSEEYSCAPPPPSLPTASPALWDYAPDPLWKIGIEEEEQLRSFFPVGTEFLGPGQQFGVCDDC